MWLLTLNGTTRDKYTRDKPWKRVSVQDWNKWRRLFDAIRKLVRAANTSKALAPAPTSANGGSETAQAAPPANPASGAPTSSPSAAVKETGGGNATGSATAGSATTTTTTGTADVNTKKASETQATAPAVQLTQEQVAEFWDNLQKVHDEFKDLLPKARAYYQA